MEPQYKYPRISPLPKVQADFMETLIRFKGQWLKAPRAINGRAILALLRRGLIERAPSTQHLDYNKSKYRVLNKEAYEALKRGNALAKY